MPSISVIVPFYNTAAYIGPCVQSLLNQTFTDFEAVCVNDGSTDASLEELQKAVGNDSRFKIVCRENGGLSAARNTGLEQAVGEYICFLDSDDCLTSSALELLYARAIEDDLDLLDFSAQTIYDNDEARQAHEENYEYRRQIEGIYAGTELFERYWQEESYASSACFHFIKRNLLVDSDLRFKEGLLHEDELFTPLLYPLAHRAAFLNEPLYMRRIREGSIMTGGRSIRNVHALYVITTTLRAWLAYHARDYDKGFLFAYARNLGLLQGTMVADAYAVTEDELGGFLNSLNAVEQADFMTQYSFGTDITARMRAMLPVSVPRRVWHGFRAAVGKFGMMARKES